MDTLLKSLIEKKQQLDRFQPLNSKALEHLEEWLKIELTYSSNAIEGNTLSRQQTAEVIEKGVSAVIPGKSLQEQLEAVNHAKALEYIKNLSRQKKSHRDITEKDINAIHKIILSSIDNEAAGIYRETEVFIRGSDVELPLPHKVPFMMNEFIQWLSAIKKMHPVFIAAEAHYRLVSIHPYKDGNGRTSRLLMNLILLIHGYPMAIIKVEERTHYLETLYTAQKQNNMRPFYILIEKSVERSLEAYINVAKRKPALLPLTKKGLNEDKNISAETYSELLKIGELAKETGETTHTLRYWTKLNLLQVTKYTESGYQLYHFSMIKRAEQIRKLQDEKRLTLEEIKQKLNLS